MLKLSASILSADFLNLGSDIKRAEESGCDCIHIDITDGHFVPNLCMGIDIAKAVCGSTDLRCDVHLMIDNPEDFILKFANAGADMIFFHAEATAHPYEMIKYIRETGKKVGVGLDPATPIEAVRPYMHAVDAINQVSVCVGFGGQSYIEATDKKLKQLVEARNQLALDYEIQVDGGINIHNALEKHAKGADTLIAGTMFFKSRDIGAVVKQLKSSC